LETPKLTGNNLAPKNKGIRWSGYIFLKNEMIRDDFKGKRGLKKRAKRRTLWNNYGKPPNE